ALGTTVLSTYLNGQYAELQGTSMAAPHITGAVLLMQARALKRFGRKFSPERIKEELQFSAEDLGEPGKDIKYGYGVFSFAYIEKQEFVRPQLRLELGSNIYFKNGLRREMDTAPVIDSNNRTLVPVRF